MHITALVRRTVNAWVLWKAHRSLRRALPALAALDTARSEIARRHRSGARAIDMRKRELVTARLMRELGRA